MLALCLLTACGTSTSASIGPERGGVHLVLDIGTAHPGEVVSAMVVAARPARSTRLIEVTCGVKDYRVARPVLGLAGPGHPSGSRAPLDQPFDTPARTTLRFVVPDLARGLCSVSRTVLVGSVVLEPRAPLRIQ